MKRDGRGRERRRNDGSFRVRPRSSPASLLVMTISAVLLATAAATALLGGRFDDATPHGRLLGALSQVADAQEAHFRESGRFADWLRTLEVDEPAGADLLLLEGDGERWRATVRDPKVGLRCSQEGNVRNGVPVRAEPICYTTSD